MSSPSERLSAIVVDFDRAVNTLISVLNHIKESSLPPNLRVVLLNSSIVSLTSTIEEAIRNQFQTYLRIVQETHLDYRWLRIELQRSNLRAALNELKRVSVPKDVSAVASAASNRHYGANSPKMVIYFRTK